MGAPPASRVVLGFYQRLRDPVKRIFYGTSADQAQILNQMSDRERRGVAMWWPHGFRLHRFSVSEILEHTYRRSISLSINPLQALRLIS
jgi:hypothetical protein